MQSLRGKKINDRPCPSRMAGFPKLSNAVLLIVWMTFRGMRKYVFKQGYAMAAELRKVPLKSSSTQPSFQMTICVMTSPISSHLLRITLLYRKEVKEVETNR
jgi:hypothetical protein